MAVVFERIRPGDVLFDRHRVKMGNTTMSRMGEWQVAVVRLTPNEQDARESPGAFVRWNGNPETWWPANRLRRLYRSRMEKKP